MQRFCLLPRFDGRLAQRLERSPHTREVKGSNPLSPTILKDSLIVCAGVLRGRTFVLKVLFRKWHTIECKSFVWC
jgi:hypothetical protein